MAKASSRRLKVFQAQLGFYDTVVAAPSQTAALRAWGVHQNLFIDGRAKVAEDPEARTAALDHPLTPLRRAIGSRQAFTEEPTSLPSVPDAPKGQAGKHPRKAKPARRPPADRAELDAAEFKLKKLDEARKGEEDDFRRRQETLDAEQRDRQSAYVEDRKRAAAEVADARRAYRKAGGTD